MPLPRAEKRCRGSNLKGGAAGAPHIVRAEAAARCLAISGGGCKPRGGLPKGVYGLFREAGTAKTLKSTVRKGHEGSA